MGVIRLIENNNGELSMKADAVHLSTTHQAYWITDGYTPFSSVALNPYGLALVPDKKDERCVYAMFRTRYGSLVVVKLNNCLYKYCNVAKEVTENLYNGISVRNTMYIDTIDMFKRVVGDTQIGDVFVGIEYDSGFVKEYTKPFIRGGYESYFMMSFMSNPEYGYVCGDNPTVVEDFSGAMDMILDTFCLYFPDSDEVSSDELKKALTKSGYYKKSGLDSGRRLLSLDMLLKVVSPAVPKWADPAMVCEDSWGRLFVVNK